MPEANASILNASANYEATDWASAEGRAGLNFRGSAELKRGFDLELGAEALVGLDANISKFLSVDVQGHANATAQVRAQVQVPLDLFDEAGLAIRLQAVAEVAAGIKLGIGLDVGDFLALAGSQPGMQGLGLRLLRIFLDEAQIGGGVMAKAAAAAMAYANIAVTGKLIDSPAQKAGFNISCEAGVGLKAGAGYRVFVGFELDDPSRMIRRTVDALVDDTLQRLADRTNDANLLRMLDGLRAPAKMALRTNFELGAELARNSGTFDPARGPVIAQRCLQVFFEEAQRYVVQQVADHAIRTFTLTLRTAGFSADTWERAQSERVTLATRLRNQPADPFEPSDDNKNYWLGVVNDSAALAVALGAANHHSAPWVASIATLWSATQLLFATVGRISSGGARASVLNSSADAPFPPYTGPTVQQAPPLIRDFFNNLRGTNSSNQTLEELVAHVCSATVLDPLIAEYPALQVVLEIAGGPGANSAATIRTLLNNLGPFIAAGANGVDPQRSIEVVLEGLRRYVNVQLQNEIEPALRGIFAGSPDELRLYLSEVVIPTLRFGTNVVFNEAANWSSADNSVQKALREACSALVMQLLGRTLVVTTDIVFDKALQGISGAFHAAVPQLNRRDGVIDKLDQLVPALDRQAIKDTVEEIFDLAADVFEPLPNAKRARIRELLLEIIDTVPRSPDAEFLDSLKNESLIPNFEAARELTLELGGLIGDSFTRLIGRIIELLANAIFEALEAIVEAIEQEVQRWVEGIETLLEDLRQWLEDVFVDIGQLGAAVRAWADDFLDQTEDFLGLLAGSKRGSVRTEILNDAYRTGKSLLWYVPGYDLLSRDDRGKVKEKLYEFLDSLLNEEIFNDVVDALGNIAGDIEGFIEDARGIDPDDDVAGELIELLAERVGRALNEHFGSRVTIEVSFNVWLGFWTFEVPLGKIRIYTSDVIDLIQSLVRNLTAVTSAAEAMADKLKRWLEDEFALDLCRANLENWSAQQETAQAQANETKNATPSIRILEPGASAAYPGNVKVEIALMGTPRSFLGLEESETSRVFVFLDEIPLDLGQFQVVDGTVTLTSERIVPGEPNGKPHNGHKPVEQSTFERLASVTPAPNPLFAARATPFKRRQAVRSQTRTQGFLSSQKSLGGEVGGVGLGRTIQIGGRQEKGNANGKISGKPRASFKREIIETVVPSLILRATVQKENLVEGFHNLTVTVTTGDKATRISESVVFYRSSEAVRPPRGGKDPVKMPVREPFAIERLVPALRELAAKGAGRTIRIGPTEVKTPKVVRLTTKSSKDVVEKSRARITEKLKVKSSRVAELRKVLGPLPKGKPAPKEKGLPKSHSLRVSPSTKDTAAPKKTVSAKKKSATKKKPSAKKRAATKKSTSASRRTSK